MILIPILIMIVSIYQLLLFLMILKIRYFYIIGHLNLKNDKFLFELYK